MNRHLVSVIITSKNEADVIGNLLNSISKQTYKNTEVILVDNKSVDKTLDIAKKYQSVKIYSFGPERSAQRNYGAKKSKGTYLLFLDADMELTPNVISKCVKAVKKEDIAGVVIPEESIAQDFWGKVKAYERSFYNETGDPITDAARFFKKDVFIKTGGYDELITGPEDWDLPDRIREAGYKIGASNGIIYHHEQNVSISGLFRKKFYYGLNAHKYLLKHNIPLISPKTVYFLRPLFYKSWKKLLSSPLLALAMIYMLFIELLGGGLGYLIGRFRR